MLARGRLTANGGICCTGPRTSNAHVDHQNQLSQTVDAFNAALFEGRPLAAAERGHVARWIAARQGLPGSYAGTFAGFPSERSRGIVLFTGERIASASARHILGEEASRALTLSLEGSGKPGASTAGRSIARTCRRS